ncbi:MAG: hypothetical protein Q4D77_01640 [Peptostreptococcaceae bacterium]|nr:hypothetical protein [Peptostreptococcaceae bacterium]
MNAFPFQSNFVKMDEHGNPIYDRAIGAEFFRGMWKLFFIDGVFSNPSSNFQVMAHSGMTVRVKPGTCFVQGVTGIEINNTDLRIDNAEELTTRTDLIVLRADFTQNRRLSVEIKKNTTTLRRDADVWELQLAKITIPPRATQIRQQDITDTRLNTAVCGIVSHQVTKIDTSTLFNQVQAYLDQKKIDWNQQQTNQQSEWQSQMQTQQQEFEQQKQLINAWYEGIQADIATLKTFVFDNWLDLPGAKYTSTKSSSGVWTTTIVVAGKKVAEKIEQPKNSQGKFVTTIKLYQKDGSGILKQVTSTEYKNASGQWIVDVV